MQLDSFSAMVSQLPCLGVKQDSTRRTKSLARADSKLLWKAPFACVLRLSSTKDTFSQPA